VTERARSAGGANRAAATLGPARATAQNSGMTDSRPSPSDLARGLAATALEEGARHGHSADAVARALLGVVIDIYRRERGAGDIRRELEFVAEHLEEDDDFPFMRP